MCIRDRDMLGSAPGCRGNHPGQGLSLIHIFIPPKPNVTIPGLHFFLTSSASPVGIEAEASSCDSSSTDRTKSINSESRIAATHTEADQKRELTPVLDARLSTHNLTVTERLTKEMCIRDRSIHYRGSHETPCPMDPGKTRPSGMAAGTL